MRFTVVCLPAAEAQLAQLWLRVFDRTALAIASGVIDEMLRDSPFTAGQPRGDIFLASYGCLAAQYRILPDDCLVEILKYELISS